MFFSLIFHIVLPASSSNKWYFNHNLSCDFQFTFSFRVRDMESRKLMNITVIFHFTPSLASEGHVTTVGFCVICCGECFYEDWRTLVSQCLKKHQSNFSCHTRDDHERCFLSFPRKNPLTNNDYFSSKRACSMPQQWLFFHATSSSSSDSCEFP